MGRVIPDWLQCTKHAPAALALRDDLTMLATVTKGLGEAGVTPSEAVNRNEVLPGMVAKQREHGLRYQVSSDLTLSSSAYSLKNPTATFDNAGVFGLSGDVGHRGLALSLAGRPIPSARLVAGAALLDAERWGGRALSAHFIPFA